LNALYGYFSEEFRRKQMRSLFAQYIPPSHLKKLLEQGKELKSETQLMTVLFCDIRNFTSIAEKMSAVAIAEVLNQFFTPMTEIIFKHGGTIDKYIGDMVMAFWGAPLTDLQHSKHAMEAALEMQTKATKLRDDFLARGLPPISIGIGINTGLMNVGDMGSEFRRSYTVIGDAVNLGSRLESLTKEYHVGIIVSETTKAQQNDFKFVKLGEALVKGKQEPVTIYELIGKMSES
jgi:adenylate cyclase